ncbi:hypothetical protein [Streptomyces sp. NPDC056491]|uniref:hypothetical protein n=1 Tax=Streptomyces sp. NPDC056491 TaxID=3345837 RepID=UPI0036BBB10B
MPSATSVMLAPAFLTAVAGDATPTRSTTPHHSARESEALHLTVPEICYLFNAVLGLAAVTAARPLHRSIWLKY